MALVTNIDGPNLLDESNDNGCENEVEEDLEDGEIFDEEDENEITESTEKITEPKLSKENRFGEGTKEKDFDSQWDVDQRSSHPHQQMLHGPQNKPFAGFNNSRPRGDRFQRNKGGMMKRDIGYQMDDDRPRRKRRRFETIDEKDSMPRNNQNGMFNKRKNNDISMEPTEDGNNEDMYGRGASPDAPNFESFPREFENEGEDFRPPRDNNFSRRGRGRRGGSSGSGGDIMDRRNRGLPLKRRMGSVMKNKRSEVEDKICQYFLQGKCLKENNCTYSHHQPTGRKMELCKFYLMDCCTKEDRCTFMHSEFPCKYYHTGMKCYSGPNCRFSHAKLDEDQKKILLKSFGKLRYDPPEYENENHDYKNKFEEDPKPNVENNLNSKIDKNKIPSLLDMQIPVPLELKSNEKNSDEEQETNVNNNDSSTPMPSPSRDESMVDDDTFEINANEQQLQQNMLPNNRSATKSRKHTEKNKEYKEKQKHEREIRRKQREERHQEKRMEKNRQRKEELPIHNNDPPLLDDLSDDDEFNDLVIDEEKFQNDGKDQQLPKKQIELLKRIQVQQKFYNEIDMNEDPSIQEEQYSSDVSEHSISTPINNVIDLLDDEDEDEDEEKEDSPISSSSKPNSSKVEKVDFDNITISDDMAKLLNSIKANFGGSDTSTKDDQPSPFHLPPLKQPYDFEESVPKMNPISDVDESPASPPCSNSNVVELGKTDVDLRQLPFQFPVAAATEIEASLDSHPPIKYQLYPTHVSLPDYSKVSHTMGIDDPRLRRNITAGRDPMFNPSVPATTVAAVRPVAPKSAPRDPRKPQQQDVNMCTPVNRTSLLPTPNALAQPRPMDSDMRHMPPPIMCPQMMAVPNDPRRKPIGVPGDPRQRHRFDVDQRINNMNYY